MYSIHHIAQNKSIIWILFIKIINYLKIQTSRIFSHFNNSFIEMKQSTQHDHIRKAMCSRWTCVNAKTSRTLQDSYLTCHISNINIKKMFEMLNIYSLRYFNVFETKLTNRNV